MHVVVVVDIEKYFRLNEKKKKKK
uniref:Uncharacterized protein n=1 Tax=Lepeophtheirus salmonis TaxID=72036 RepID=A0A0K2UE04_LEPSM